MFSNLKSAWESRCHNPIYDGHMSVTDELVKKGWGGKPMGASQRTFLLAGGLVLLKCKESWGECNHPLIHEMRQFTPREAGKFRKKQSP